MATLKGHPKEDLIRYLDGELAGDEKRHMEEHLHACGDCRERLSFAKDFNAGLSQLTASELPSGEACPDSWALVSFEAGEMNEETARNVRAHMLFCDECAEAYYALRRARPKRLEMVLRFARDVIEALHFPGEATVLAPAHAATRGDLRPAFAAPFRISESLTDDEGQTSRVTLRVENAIRLPEEHVRIVFECDPVPKEWRARLDDIDVSIDRPQKELSAELEHGFYVVEITKDGDNLGEFAFTVEPFSLPEATEAALRYIELRDYDRALAVLEDAAKRYPEDQDLWHLRALALTLAAKDTEEIPEEAEEEEVENRRAMRVRSVRDYAEWAWEALGEAKARFGETIASFIGTATLEPALVRAGVAASLAGQTSSLPVLRAIELLNERLAAMEGRVAQLVPVLDQVHSRLDRFSASLDSLQDSMASIRRDPEQTADDKFGRIGDLLERFVNNALSNGVSLYHYKPLFEENLGNECWSWLDPESREIFVSGEAVYRYIGSLPAREDPDFSPALLQLCRGLELLCNVKLKNICSTVAEAVGGSQGLLSLARQQLPRIDVDRALRIERTISLTQIANILAIGRTVQVVPGSLPRFVEALLTSSPGLACNEVLATLAQIGIFFRNGKVHPEPESPSLFTSAEEIHILRKLVFGFDEYCVHSGGFLRRLDNPRWWWFGELEREAAKEGLSRAWGTYAGLLTILLKALSARNNR